MDADPRVVNVAAYRFVPLADLPQRRTALQELCRRLALKGTILLSPEGINLFLAGGRQAVDELLAFLRRDPLLADLEAKESFSDRQPFRRMLVRLKKEIIAFGAPDIDPGRRSSPKISAETLKQWLDEGRDIVLLDTRNEYEVKLGAFAGAARLPLQHFRDFPSAAARLPEELKSKPLVAYCTGGIRCEKAGPYLEQAGFQEVYQLEGGILKYFERCGGAHYQGDCFVFDQRVALDASLQETEAAVCFACQATLTPEEQQSPRYVMGVSCPACYVDGEQLRLLRRRRFEEKLQAATRPLPGSVPRDNRRPLNVPARFDGLSLLEMLERWHSHVGRQEWLQEIHAGRLLDGSRPLEPQSVVRAGQRLEHLFPSEVEPEVSNQIVWLYEDDDLLVVHKPAPLPMHPSGRFHRNTLMRFLQQAVPEVKLRAIHRLDANTTGVTACAKNRTAATRLHEQFARRTVRKMYLARVSGEPAWERFRCETPIGDTVEEAGVRLPAGDGRAAVTDFEVLSRDADSTLLRVIPLTGRTNQIRAHLWSLGLPVLGDPAYLPGGRLGAQQTLPLTAAPMCLQAQVLEFQHPADLRPLRFEAPVPPWRVADR